MLKRHRVTDESSVVFEGSQSNYFSDPTRSDPPSKRKRVESISFLEKLSTILDDEDLKGVIEWSKNGDSFLVKDTAIFTESVLPKYFKHNNFQSFIRQLNMYNFRKVRHDDGCAEFFQPQFQKNKPDLYKRIKRRVNTNQSSKQEKTKKNTVRLHADIRHVAQQVSDLIQRQEKSATMLREMSNRYIALRKISEEMWKLILEDKSITEDYAQSLFFGMLQKQQEFQQSGIVHPQAQRSIEQNHGKMQVHDAEDSRTKWSTPITAKKLSLPPLKIPGKSTNRALSVSFLTSDSSSGTVDQEVRTSIPDIHTSTDIVKSQSHICHEGLPGLSRALCNEDSSDSLRRFYYDSSSQFPSSMLQAPKEQSEYSYAGLFS